MPKYILSAEQHDAALQYARTYDVSLNVATRDAILQQREHPDLTFEECLILAAEQREGRDAEADPDVDVVDDR